MKIMASDMTLDEKINYLVVTQHQHALLQMPYGKVREMIEDVTTFSRSCLKTDGENHGE
jgi:hypothetical protein